METHVSPDGGSRHVLIDVQRGEEQLLEQGEHQRLGRGGYGGLERKREGDGASPG